MCETKAKLFDKKISIIVPVYNAENYIKKCVDSILAQTYTNLEIILVDDGSPDNCGKICDEYGAKDSRIIVIHKENGGVSSARNVGLKIATGEYVTFVDSDDYIGDSYIEAFVSHIDSEDNVLVCMHIDVIADSGEMAENVVFDKTTTIVIDKDYDFCAVPCNCLSATKLYKKSILNGKTFDENCANGEDALFFAGVVLEAKRIKYIPESGYYYVYYAESLTNGTINERKLSVLDAWKTIIDLFSDYPKSQKSGIAMYLFLAMHLYSQSILQYGNKNEYANFIKKELFSKGRTWRYSDANAKVKYSLILLRVSPLLYSFVYRVRNKLR